MSLARTRIAARLLAVAALAALTAGCFQPMYAEHADGSPGLREKLMGVEVPPVEKLNASREARIQVEVRNALDQTNKVLKILDDDRARLGTLIDASDTVLGQLAAKRNQVTSFIDRSRPACGSSWRPPCCPATSPQRW